MTRLYHMNISDHNYTQGLVLLLLAHETTGWWRVVFGVAAAFFFFVSVAANHVARAEPEL